MPARAWLDLNGRNSDPKSNRVAPEIDLIPAAVSAGRVAAIMGE